MMFYPFKKRSWLFFAVMFCALSFFLILGAQQTWAGGKTGCTKTCKIKESGQSCPMLKLGTSESETPEQQANAGKVLSLDAFSRVELYTCPMHPEVRSEKSGKCPECGMKLVKGDFYEIYTCTPKDCPHPCVFPKAGKCCGKDLQKRVMSKDEYYGFAQLQDEYFCPMHSEVISDQAGKCPKCGMKLEMRTVHKEGKESSEMTSYVCPMHPDKICSQSGNCSKCGMKLQKKPTSE
jgi:hypothetical protein